MCGSCVELCGMCRFCQGLEDFCTQSELETLSFASKRMFWDCRDRIGKVRGAGGLKHRRLARKHFD